MARLHPSRDAPDLSAMTNVPIQSLGNAVLTAYRDNFEVALSEGRAKPMLIPFCLLAPFIVPALWLAIPHRRRQWLYSTRWLVMAFIVWSNIEHVLYASSTNIACSYAAGLAATWGTMSTMNLLIWTRPQLDAARNLRVRKKEMGSHRQEGNGNAKETDEEPQQNGNGHVHENGNGLRRRGNAHKLEDQQQRIIPQEDDQFDYVWEPYPEAGSFLERLGWATDLILSFRCAGWNWSVSSVPRPKVPLEIREGELINVESIPRITRCGYKRCTSESEFVRDRLFKVVAMYLVLDFLAVFMMKDPYFILGPDHQNFRLPSHLQQVPSVVLHAYRQVFSLAGVYAAIEAIFGVSDLVQYWITNRFFPSRGGLWQYASTFGSFEQVLDRGLAGWWGSWWHQTFRMQFLAPVTYLIREGYLKKGTTFTSLVAVLVSFMQSGILHASGSFTSIPKTKPWRSPAFFLLQVLGIVLQQGLSQAIRKIIPQPPHLALSRAANLLFSLTWLYLTAGFFIDDCASTGLWLLEPVPISPLRFFGLGYPGDHWWRWDRHAFPRLHVGETWWKSGIAV